MNHAAPESMSAHGFFVFVTLIIMILTGLRFGDTTLPAVGFTETRQTR